MNTSSEDFCKRAVPYLMSSPSAAKAPMEVSELDAPVITSLNNGLLVGYLIDQGEYFQYVQQRHLADARMTEAALH